MATKIVLFYFASWLKSMHTARQTLNSGSHGLLCCRGNIAAWIGERSLNSEYQTEKWQTLFAEFGDWIKFHQELPITRQSAV